MTTGGSADAAGPRLLSASERAELLLDWLTTDGRLDVADAAGRLGVAQETVRRDLRVLESRSKLIRVHGGAVRLQDQPLPDGAIPGLPRNVEANRASPGSEATADDRALVERLWAELPHHGTLLLGTGRLTLELARVMVQDPPTSSGLTVVTNSLDVGLVLSRAARLSVYNIGGTVSPVTRAQEGDWALTELQRLHTDVSVVCPAGISLERGLSQPTPGAAAVSQAEVAAGERVVALVEAEALGRSSFVTFAAIEDVAHLVVAGRPAPALLSVFAERGVSCTAGDTAASEPIRTPEPPRAPGPTRMEQMR